MVFAHEEGDVSSCELLVEAAPKPQASHGRRHPVIIAGAALAVALVGAACALRSGALTRPSQMRGWEALARLDAEACPYQTYAYAAWSGPIRAGTCGEVQIPPKSGSVQGTISCKLEKGIKTYRFPAGIYEIDEQMLVPEKVAIVGAKNPNDMSNPTQSPDWKQQTLFLATRGVTSYTMNYCHASDMVRTRVGFVLSSYVTVRDVSYQGVDTIRPNDNGGLCGGAAFETKGCATNDCSTDVNNGGSDGQGSVHVTIENVRLNDYYFAEDKAKVGAAVPGNTECNTWDFNAECCFCKPNGIRSSQVGVWIPESRGSEGTQHFFVNNVVSSSNQADGINLHGKVHHAWVQNTYFANTGDDTYALWGAKSNPTNVTFKDNVAVSPGILRPNWYGVCVATYGLKDVVFDSVTCRGPTSEQAIPMPGGQGYINYGTSMFVFYTSFSAGYPSGNSITIKGFTFTDLEGTSYTPSAGNKDWPKRGKMVWTKSNSGVEAPYYLGDKKQVNVVVH